MRSNLSFNPSSEIRARERSRRLIQILKGGRDHSEIASNRELFRQYIGFDVAARREYERRLPSLAAMRRLDRKIGVDDLPHIQQQGFVLIHCCLCQRTRN